MKRYSFNTSARVKIGDRFRSDQYSTDMQVVDIFDTVYKYVDINSGELSNKRKASTKQYEIREVTIKDKKNEDAIEAERLND